MQIDFYKHREIIVILANAGIHGLTKKFKPGVSTMDPRSSRGRQRDKYLTARNQSRRLLCRMSIRDACLAEMEYGGGEDCAGVALGEFQGQQFQETLY